MKDAKLAPAFAVIYAGLAEVARAHGYSLAIHGSLINDLDLVAVPWVKETATPHELAAALAKHCSAVLSLSEGEKVPEAKPHGRLAWNLYMGHGAKVDLSVTPTQKGGAILSDDELNLARQWFGSVEDKNPRFLEKADYQLAARLYQLFGMRITNSMKEGLALDT